MKDKKYYVQPDVPTSITCWLFTGMIFLFSMLLWLEITVFQMWTLSILIIFLIVSFIELKKRYITISDTEIKYHALIVYNDLVIKRNEIQKVTVNKWGVIKINTPERNYEFLTNPKIADRLVKKIGLEN